MNLPNDISRCLGYKCSPTLKQSCKRWVDNDKSGYKTLPVSDFTPTKEQGSKWNCKYKIEFKRKK